MEVARVDMRRADQSDGRTVGQMKDGVASVLRLRSDDLLGRSVQLSGERGAAMLRSADGIEPVPGRIAAADAVVAAG